MRAFILPISDFDTTKKLQKLYKISTKPNKQTGNRDITPATIDRETGDLRPIKMTTDVERAFQEWKNDLVRPEDLKNRMQRYSDLDFMTCNCGFIEQAVKLYANEAITPDEDGKIIQVYARDKKVESYINDFFKKIGITRSILENTSYDIAKFADHFWIRSIDPKDGIVEITPIDCREVKQRLEFSAIDEQNRILNKRNYSFTTANSINIQGVVDAITKKIKDSDYAAMYKRYLYGFQIGSADEVLPPWSVSHFRRFSTQNEFAPFGRPLLINSLSLFREYKSALNLQAMARVAKLPKEVFEVTVSEGMTPVEKLAVANEARQEFLNLVDYNNGREEVGIGSSIWTVSGCIEYKILQNPIDIEDMDPNSVKEELIASTLIPKGYLISGEAWGESGKALLQQSKLFAREVFTNQTAILNELTDIVKTQFVLMNMFDKENTEFELSLAYPNSEQSNDILENKKATMDLANSVIENLKTALAIDSIPADVAKDILRTYASIDSKDLDKWMNKIEASINLQIKQPDYEEPKYEATRKKLARLNEDIFREAYFDAKKANALSEGVINNQHYIFNYKTSPSEAIKYDVLREMTSKKLEE